MFEFFTLSSEPVPDFPFNIISLKGYYIVWGIWDIIHVVLFQLRALPAVGLLGLDHKPLDVPISCITHTQLMGPVKLKIQTKKTKTQSDLSQAILHRKGKSNQTHSLGLIFFLKSLKLFLNTTPMTHSGKCIWVTGK